MMFQICEVSRMPPVRDYQEQLRERPIATATSGCSALASHSCPSRLLGCLPDSCLLVFCLLSSCLSVSFVRVE